MMSADALPQPRPSLLCSIHIPLHEHEQAGSDFSSWPQAVQNRTLHELAEWAKRHPTASIVEQKHSFDPGFRVCVTSIQAEALS
jgi:hypothetical protein